MLSIYTNEFFDQKVGKSFKKILIKIKVLSDKLQIKFLEKIKFIPLLLCGNQFY
ncbi:hypothetical protein Q787_00425 [Ornithobacterium rhinotracheale H06-030791]|nr:hypothetical protein Q785_00480 [Ornithobacterium rhinotracheale ORT-UMN 88]KGB67744.1 hypothetical protein Q787_00425 [Ornithobacterium rhinotracheale H06-030791]